MARPVPSRLIAKLSIGVILWVPVAVGFLPQAHGLATSGGIAGIVVDGRPAMRSSRVVVPRDLRPVRGADIRVIEPGSRTSSDGAGNFALPAVSVVRPFAKVDVEVRAPGFGVWRMSGLPVWQGLTTELYVQLEAAPVSEAYEMPHPRAANPLPAHASPESTCSGYSSNTMSPGSVQIYRKQLGVIQTYDFNFYVKHVLPHEWIASWQPEALKAGAVAVMDYGWYWINNWRGGTFGGHCYDVDDTTSYQVFDPTVSVSSTDDAVNKTWGWLTRQSGSIFETSYNSGQSTDACGQDNGLPANGQAASQWGTQACAIAGELWQQIVTTYYFPNVGSTRAGFGPAVAAKMDGSEEDVFAVGSDANVYEKSWTSTGTGCPRDRPLCIRVHAPLAGWGGWVSRGAPNPGVVGAVSDPGAVWWQGDARLDVFIRGSDDQLYQRYWTNGSWSSWIALGGVLASGPAVAAWTTGNRIDVFVEGTDSHLWHKYWTDPGRWTGWSDLGGTVTSGAGAVWWATNSRLDVYARKYVLGSADNQVWQRYDVTSWTSWSSLGGDTTSAPAATAWRPGGSRLDVFVRGVDNAVWQKYWTGSQWTGWASRGGVASSDPGAIWWVNNGLLDVFVRGTDNNLWNRNWNGSRWSSWVNLGPYVG